MKRPYLLISAAWLIQAVSWFLPVIFLSVTNGGVVVFAKTLLGWEAFNLAAGGLSPHSSIYGTWWAAIIGTVSVVSTVLFIFALGWVVYRGSRSLRLVCGWFAIVALIVNAQWYILSSNKPDFRIGYFLWWFSFGVLAVGMFDLARHQPLRVNKTTPSV